MTQALAIPHAQAAWEEKLELIKKQLAPEASAAELEMFLYQARRTGLDPLARQVYLVSRNSKNPKTGEWEKKATIQLSIDGMRLVAQRSGKYAGQTPVQWCGEDGVWKDVWLGKKFPSAAKVGIYHADFKEPLIAIATWDAYCQTKSNGEPTAMWTKMGATMLAKCAEMLGLRKAFPQELSGLYGQEEMDQATTVDVEVVESKPALPAPAKVPALPAPAPVEAQSAEPETPPADPTIGFGNGPDVEPTETEGAVAGLKQVMAMCKTATMAQKAWREWRDKINDAPSLNAGQAIYKARKAELEGGKA